MDDPKENEILERIAKSLERLANRFAPEKAKTEIRPASLSTATYSREEREMRDFKKGLPPSGSKRDASRPSRTDL